MLMENYDYSNGGFSLSQQDAEELAARLHIGLSIITFNADQLRGICYYLLILHESFRRNVLEKRDSALQEPTLNSKQMAIALEFYLQIDGKWHAQIDILFLVFRLYMIICFSGHILYENLFISRSRTSISHGRSILWRRTT